MYTEILSSELGTSIGVETQKFLSVMAVTSQTHCSNLLAVTEDLQLLQKMELSEGSLFLLFELL